MTKKTDPRRVACDTTIVLRHPGGSLADGMIRFARTIVPVHALAEGIDRFPVPSLRRAHGMSRNRGFQRRALHRHHRLAAHESEFGIE